MSNTVSGSSVAKAKAHEAGYDSEELEDMLGGRGRSLQQRLARFLYVSHVGRYMDSINVILSLLACGLYVYETYNDPTAATPVVFALEVLIAMYFTFDYLVYLAAASNRLSYLTSWEAILDLVTIGPVILEVTLGDSGSTNLVLFLRIVRVLRILRAYRVNRFRLDSVYRQALVLFFTVFALVFCAAGIIRLVEATPLQEDSETQEITFGDSMYFIVVTLATVGYGELHPITPLGKFVISFFIVGGLVAVPTQSARLYGILASRSKYSGSYRPSTSEERHVVICGSLEETTVLDFLEEFFHPDHVDNFDMKVIILDHEEPKEEIRFILREASYTRNLEYIRGSPMLTRDLQRVRANEAAAVFVFSNQYEPDHVEQDKETLLRTLSINKFDSSIKIIVKLIRPEHKEHLQARGLAESIVCIDELKLNLLAKSCICPGISTLACNLIKSANPETVNLKGWMLEYVMGSSFEIYEVHLARFEGQTFSDAAQKIFEEFGTTLLGVQVKARNEDNHMRRYVLLNPGRRYTITGKEKGFLLAQDYATVRAIQTVGVASKAKATTLSRSTRERKRSSRTNRMASALRGASFIHKRRPVAESNEVFKKLLRQSVQDELSGHILVCGLVDGIANFIAPLRAPILATHQPIVILTADPPHETDLQLIAEFDNVMLVHGSPLNTLDLERAGVRDATRIVVLTKNEIPSSGVNQNMVAESAMLDADSILSVMAIDSMGVDASRYTIVDMLSNTNVKFLRESPDGDINYRSTASFAAGAVYTSSMLDTLATQAYFNKNIVAIIQQLATSAQVNPAVDDMQAHIFSVPVPAALNGQTYGDLFKLLTDHDVVSLGLYRARHVTSSRQYKYFVSTNPPPSTIVKQEDYIYALAASDPTHAIEQWVGNFKPTGRGKNFRNRSSSRKR